MDDRTFDESHRNEESPRIQQKVHGKMLCPLDGVGFNNHGRFIRISEFATNRKSSFLIIPEDEKGRGWRILKARCLQCWWFPLRMQSKKEGNIEGKDFPIITWVLYIGPSQKYVKWVEVDRAVARSLGKKGIVTIVPILVATMVAKGKFGNREEVQRRLDRITRVAISSMVSPPSFDRGDRQGLGVYRFRRSVGNEDGRRGSVKGESTREAIASHSGTGGGRQGERVRSTAGGDAVQWLVGTEEAGVRARGDEASAVEGYRAYKRKAAQSLSKTGPKYAKSSSSAKKKVMFSSKKLWSTLFPPSSESQQGLRCRSEPLLHGKNQADSKEDPKEEAPGADFQAD
ncbi:hypothetical protein CK203_095328 [Vitis vinifera]|uniref:DUF4283 domain-containing protein n=1 Tax=Vitis vinifera TaxID=29760 RepID=A0A438E704_VITVI|nr:hypothetical protein CK203_095328 [Vitis vinifera]